MKRQPLKRIILVTIILILVPLIIYGGSIGLRIYNLYQTMHQSVEDEDFEEYEGDDPDRSDEDDNEDQDPEDDSPDLTDEEREALQVPEEDIEAYQFNDNQYYDLPRSPDDPNLLHILLMGIDSHQVGGGGRSDSMMLVRFNKETEEAAIVSVPRDTYIKIPDRGFEKAGHATAYGGTALLIETLENYFDLTIDHYIRVDMRSFEIGVDALGGLTIDVPSRMVQHDGKLLFEAGEQHMTGDDILEYTRARRLISGEGTDFGRINRQQQVVIEMLRKIRQDLSLYQTLDFMEEVARYFRTDMTPGTVASNWRPFNRMNLDEIETLRLEGEAFTHNGVYYYRVRSRMPGNLWRI